MLKQISLSWTLAAGLIVALSATGLFITSAFASPVVPSFVDDDVLPNTNGKIPSGTLWVTNRSTDEVTVFDAGSGDVIDTISGLDDPIGITAPPGTGKVYVTNDDAGTVSVIDKSSLTVVDTIPTSPKPHHMTHSPNGRFVYAATFGTYEIAVIDTKSDTLVDHYSDGTGTAGTHAVDVSGNGKVLYSANSNDDSISAVNAKTGAFLWSLPVGDRPSEILVTPDGKTGYVTIRNEDKVQVVDLTVPEIVGEVAVGDQPDTLQLTADLKTLVVALRATNPARVDLVNTKTLAVTPVIIPGPADTTTGHQWVSANGHYTYVAVESPGGVGNVTVIDNRAAVVVDSYAFPGATRPHGVFYEPSRLK